MKKVIFIMLAVVGLLSFTQVVDIENMFKDTTQLVNNAPSGTTYGVIESNDKTITINTPIGEYFVDKTEDGYYSFMGLKAKVKSKKKNIYYIETSIGNFKVDSNKLTIVKQ